MAQQKGTVDEAGPFFYGKMEALLLLFELTKNRTWQLS